MTKALSESRKVVNDDVIKSIYGDLATPELTELVTQVMDGVSDRVSVEFDSILASHDVDNKLQKLEEVRHCSGGGDIAVSSLVCLPLAFHRCPPHASLSPPPPHPSQLIKKAGASDAPSGKNEAFASLLPDGVTPHDVLRMNTHEMKLAERERLLAEIASLDKANDAVVAEIEDGKKQLASKLQDIESQRLEMQKTADICTMSS